MPLNPRPSAASGRTPLRVKREDDSLGQQFNRFLGNQENKKVHCFWLALGFGGELFCSHVTSGDHIDLSFYRPGVWLVWLWFFFFFSLNDLIVSFEVLGCSLHVHTCADGSFPSSTRQCARWPARSVCVSYPPRFMVPSGSFFSSLHWICSLCFL